MTIITALPTSPARSQDAATFVINSDAMMAALPTLVSQINTVAGEVNAAAAAGAASQVASAGNASAANGYQLAAAASAAAAAVSTGIGLWVTSTVYAQYVVAISPTDFQNYRRIISSGAATTVDPAADSTGWRLMGFTKAQVIKTSAFTAVNGDRLMIDTQSAAFTGNFPASPQAGWKVAITDYRNYFGINTFTLGRNGSLIEGVAQDMDITLKGFSSLFEYIDATMGWKRTS